MSLKNVRTSFIAGTMLATVSGVATAGDQSALAALAYGEHRSEANVARNVYRHPVETLSFFGVQPDMTVIEISPGGGWYQEILGPYLAKEGKYVAASYDMDVEDQREYRTRQHQAMLERFETHRNVYNKPGIVTFDPPNTVDLGPDGSADMVVTFRNTHGWVNNGVQEDAFKAFYDVLKPGGVLGFVQHRAPHGGNPEHWAKLGYVPQDAVIAWAEAAGFTLDASSEVNGNAADSKGHAYGVWTLPPSYRLGDENKAHYQAIGESDRMTLRFVKPKS